MFRKYILRSGTYIGIISVVFFLFYSNLNMNYFEYFELKTYDLRYKIKELFDKKDRDFDVVIVGIDEKSLVNIGPWPWNRGLHADLVKKLNKLGAKSIGFDVSFSEEGKSTQYLEYKNNLKQILAKGYKSKEISTDLVKDLAKEINKLDVEEDYKFALALKEAGNVILGTYNVLDPLEVLNEETLKNEEHYKNRYFLMKGIEEELTEVRRIGRKFSNPFEIYKIIPPITLLAKFVGIGPYEVGYPDPDGVLRGIVAVTKETYSNLYFPPLYLLTYLKAYEYNMKKDVVYNIKENSIDLYKEDKKEKSIPTNINGYQRLFFYGKGRTFKYISYWDVINDKVEGDEIKDKIVLVGYTDTAKGLYDLRATPLDPNTSGVELHATAIQNLIDNKYMIRLDILPHILLILLFTSTITLLLANKRISLSASNVLVVGVILIYLLLSYLLFIKGIWIEIFYPLLTYFTAHILLNTESYFREEKEKKYIKDVFGSYINPQLVNELVNSHEELKLGGEKKQLTVLFSDIKGFTTISESLTPEELIELLNEYLSVTSDIILVNNGTIDKYIGDAIMAIYGAPVYKETHAYDACNTALLYQAALEKMRERNKAEGKKIIRARIGINTGDMVVGNMGCNIGEKKKFNYTVIGDEVNLASRLESAGKFYGTEILVGPKTYETVKDEFVFRLIDYVRVKGKAKAVGVYELLGKKGDKVEYLEIYNNAMEKYHNRDFDEAKSLFEQVREVKAEDKASEIYLSRIEDYKENPPSDEWDYSFTMTTK